jgi:predicted nucleic acid-binding protein
MSLTRLYIAYGALEPALAELEAVLRTVREERQMLNHYKEWECDLPVLAMDVLGLKLRMQPDAAVPHDAVYLALMVRTYGYRPFVSFFPL